MPLPPETFPNRWEIISYYWRWTNPLSRFDVYVLAGLLFWVIAVASTAFYRTFVFRHARLADRSNLIADVNVLVGSLKSIASIAPYVGTVGTCFGIMGTFRGFAMEAHAARVMLVSIIVASLIPTAAGLVVAVPATWSYNHLRTSVDALKGAAWNPALNRYRRRFPLRQRFSELPAFAVLSAPTLAVAFVAFMVFPSYSEAVGFPVRLLKSDSELSLSGQVIVLRLTRDKAGLPALCLNSTATDWFEVKDVLRYKLRTRPEKVVYLQADDDVLWMDVMSAVEMIQEAHGKAVLLTSKPTPHHARAPQQGRLPRCK